MEDSENYWMYKLMLQVAAILRGWGLEVDAADNTDFDKSGGLSFNDNVKWVNSLRHRNHLVGFSFHSDASGDSMLLHGPSAAARKFAEQLQSVLHAMAFMPFGDRFEFYARRVAETYSTYCPVILIEVGRHDTVVYAEWLRTNILNGFLAGKFAEAIARTIGFQIPSEAPPAEELVVTTPKPAPAVSAPDWPLDNGCHSHGKNAYFGPRYPMSNLRSVSGYYSHSGDLKAWQQQMKNRGWRIDVTGHYDELTERACRLFQKEKGLTVDGAIGRNTWNAAWLEPVT